MRPTQPSLLNLATLFLDSHHPNHGTRSGRFCENKIPPHFGERKGIWSRIQPQESLRLAIEAKDTGQSEAPTLVRNSVVGRKKDIKLCSRGARTVEINNVVEDHKTCSFPRPRWFLGGVLRPCGGHAPDLRAHRISRPKGSDGKRWVL